MRSVYWLFGKKADILVLYAPVWLCWVIAFTLPYGALHSDVPLWVWVTVVIGIDVSHVWSSMYRTYFDSEEFNNHKLILITAPVLSFVIAFGVVSISIALFWRCLAYLAVYHFIKQQFGFMRIYKAKARDVRPKKISDNFIIYFSMLYPIFFWHLHADREFAWFVHGDFFSIPLHDSIKIGLSVLGNSMYVLFLFAWLAEELWYSKKSNVALPAGKILWVLTTAGNWFFGIVYFNSDTVFTITNVVAHGVPYLALILFYKTRKATIKASSYSAKRNWGIALIILSSIFLFAVIEEYLWDVLVYRDNEDFFSILAPYFLDTPSRTFQLLSIAFLAVPQVTHYILDGFIWKNNEKNPYLKDILLK